MATSKTGTATSRWRKMIRAVLCLAMLGGLWWSFWWHHVKRFQAIEPGVVYRTAQPTEFGLWYLARRHGVRTVINLRLEDPMLLGGIVDLNQPDGCRESEQVSRLGLQMVSWPMGEEACWPWLSAWQFEEFYELFDEPANLPAVMHCVGGRHRTGTISALYRMEYCRWTAERAIEEMLSFSFGAPVPIQDHNLRTYVPRARPNADQWAGLQRHFADLFPSAPPRDYETLVHALKGLIQTSEAHDSTCRRLADYIATGRAFALPLAERLIDNPQHPLADLAACRAVSCLTNADSAGADWIAAAAIVADHGDPEQQLRLLDILAGEPREGVPSARYQAAVAGVTNRYTINRLPFLRPLLDDRRQRVEPAATAYRYCDTAAARMSAIQDINFLLPGWNWDEGVEHARQWFEESPDRQQLSQLIRPSGAQSAGRVASPADVDRVFQR